MSLRRVLDLVQYAATSFSETFTKINFSYINLNGTDGRSQSSRLPETTLGSRNIIICVGGCIIMSISIKYVHQITHFEA